MGRAVGLVLGFCCIFSLLPFESPLPREHPGANAATVVALSPDSIRTDLSDYIWPTDAGTIITSTFAEFRAMHFHGGIDISTGDNIGYRVFASRDGYVSRISISPNGYGKMLFVRHADGYTTVYAHLSRFAQAVNTRASQEQRRSECYPINIECGPGELPVRKGEVIAYTGDTGIGTPHLHFEIRDDNLDAVNPQLAEHLRMTDGIAPTISAIAIVPLDEFARVHGGWEAQVYRAHPVESNRWTISETANITGRVGFAISVRDRTEGSRFRRGIYRNTLYIDNQAVFSAQLDRAPMRSPQQVGLYYSWDLPDRGQGRFQRLYADGNGPHPFLSNRSAEDGIINSGQFTEGRHSFRVVSQDIAGNQSEVRGTVVFNHPPDFQMEASANELVLRFVDPAAVDRILLSTARQGFSGWSVHTITPERTAEESLVRVPLPAGAYDVVKVVAQNAWGTKSVPRFYFLRKPSYAGQSFGLEHSNENGFVRVLARTSGMFTVPPSVTVDEGGKRRRVPMVAVDVDMYIGSFRPTDTVAGPRTCSAEAEVNGRRLSAFDEFSLYPILPGRSGSFIIDDGRLELTYDSLTAYSTIFLEVEKEVQDGEPSYTLLPLRTVLGGSLKVAFKGNPVIQHQGLYFRGRSSRELLASEQEEPGHRFHGKITRTLGELYLDVDDSPPSVSRLQVSARSGRPVVNFRVSDYGSGIEYESLKMYIDKNVAIPEIDGEHRRVQYQASDPLERGYHLLTIRLKDRAGNSSSVERRFFVH
jgi:hypothetical protein